MELNLPLGRAERIAMEIRRSEAIEGSCRAHRRFLRRALLIIMTWNVAGLGLMGLSFHLADLKYAEMAFQLRFAVGYGGMFFSAVFIYVRGRETGQFE